MGYSRPESTAVGFDERKGRREKASRFFPIGKKGKGEKGGRDDYLSEKLESNASIAFDIKLMKREMSHRGGKKKGRYPFL